jgi:hypothetical protein
MNKFHQIPTDKFVPISHDNSYLFNHYEKVANFLAFNLEKNYKNILAKPVQNGYAFDWFSVYENLVNINEKPTTETETSLLKYWEFIEFINAKVQQLSISNDENNKNWANLLTKVFNRQDNFIFSNGKDICIVWGWKFDNNEIYKPNIGQKQNLDFVPKETVNTIENPLENSNPKIEPTNSVVDPIDEAPIEECLIEDIPNIEYIDKEKIDFLEFLKWFASKYWWLLWLLTFLSAIVFFYKTLYFNNHL